VKLSWCFILLMIVAPAVSRQLSDELKAWMPWLVRCLTERAVRQLTVGERDRFAEEWPARVGEVPGEVGKLVFAAWLARRRIRSPAKSEEALGEI